MALEYMKITGYKDENFTQAVSGDPYYLMMNPDSIKWTRFLENNEQHPIRSCAASQKYKSTPSDYISIDILIDCTGILDNKRTGLADEIKALEDIVYTYNGEIKTPNFVKIQWGSDLVFYSVLKSFDTTHKLFKPDGNLLRAKISLSFRKYISPDKRTKEDRESSPESSHIVKVVQGESLPQLSNKVWNTPHYYIQVAQYNDLNKFRQLKVGVQLLFPPIIKPT
jgi:hypothetical protein